MCIGFLKKFVKVVINNAGKNATLLSGYLQVDNSLHSYLFTAFVTAY